MEELRRGSTGECSLLAEVSHDERPLLAGNGEWESGKRPRRVLL